MTVGVWLMMRVIVQGLGGDDDGCKCLTVVMIVVGVVGGDDVTG